MQKQLNYFMFDTNVFNDILDNQISLNSFNQKNIMLCATHVLFDELNNTKNKKRRDETLHVFETIIDSSLETESSAVGQSRVGFCKTGETLPTESSVYGNSKYGQSKYTDTNSLRIKTPLLDFLYLFNSLQKIVYASYIIVFIVLISSFLHAHVVYCILNYHL